MTVYVYVNVQKEEKEKEEKKNFVFSGFGPCHFYEYSCIYANVFVRGCFCLLVCVFV